MSQGDGGGASSGDGPGDDYSEEDLYSSADGDETLFPFDDSDCEAAGWGASSGGRGGNPKGSTLAPDQLDKARQRDVHLIARVSRGEGRIGVAFFAFRSWGGQRVKMVGESWGLALRTCAWFVRFPGFGCREFGDSRARGGQTATVRDRCGGSPR